LSDPVGVDRAEGKPVIMPPAGLITILFCDHKNSFIKLIAKINPFLIGEVKVHPGLYRSLFHTFLNIFCNGISQAVFRAVINFPLADIPAK
jgi:hypothetical protein